MSANLRTDVTRPPLARRALNFCGKSSPLLRSRYICARVAVTRAIQLTRRHTIARSGASRPGKFNFLRVTLRYNVPLASLGKNALTHYPLPSGAYPGGAYVARAERRYENFIGIVPRVLRRHRLA